MAAWLCLLAPANADEASDRSAKEYQLKAAFLYNFVKFIQWPESAGAEPDTRSQYLHCR